MWRTTPVHRWGLEGSVAEDSPPALANGVDLEGIQEPRDGVGELFRRVYGTTIRGSGLEAEGLMRRLASDLDALAPGELAKFVKARGEDGRLGRSV
jgi:hypothetical protein